MGHRSALEGHQAHLHGGRRRAPARLGAGRAHARQARRRKAVGMRQQRAVRQLARRADRQPGDAAGQGRPEGDLSVGLAGRGRRQRRRRNVSGPVAVSGELGAARREAHQQHAQARRPDPVVRRQESGRRRLHRLLRADRGRCGSRLRRRAERVRTDEGDDRSGRRGRALRRPARVGEEVRPHGRQGAGADARKHRQADRRAPRRRRLRHADRPARPHRRGSRRPGHLRHRRQRQAVPDRRAHGGRLLPHASRASSRRSRAASPTRRTPT